MATQTQQQNIAAAFSRLVSASNQLNAYIGNLSSLGTNTKASLVAALNELQFDIESLPALVTLINDAATVTTSTWSSAQIQAQINAAITALIAGSPAGEQTLGAIAAQLASIAAQENTLLSFGAAQTLTTVQQIVACVNLGIGDPTYDFVNAAGSGINAALAPGL